MLFHHHVAVDWSASGIPVTGPDSIWIASETGGSVTAENPPTRAAAEDRLARFLGQATARGERAILGFDFPLGYPRGLSQSIRPGGTWRDVWDEIARLVTDDARNRNNRFDAAAALNARFAGEGPFWGNALGRDIPGLPRRKPEGWGRSLPANRRRAETLAPGAQEVWKLAGIGSVGGQALTGIAMLARLRRRVPLSIWPFEGWQEGHVAAEIYPSLLGPDLPEAPETARDARQVRAYAAWLAEADRTGALAAMLAADLPPEVRSDEGTILGPGLPPARGRTGRPAPLRYLRDPAAIYARSFATVAAEARLDRFPADVRPIAARVVHASGMTDVADRLAFSPGAGRAGAAALSRGAPILCDCEMVAAGIARARLRAGNAVLVTLNDPAVPDLARTLGTTRSAAAVELWRDRIEGAVVAIGNAPTALFRLLELVDGGFPRPALLLAFPVGFVGAAESKAELAANPRGIPFVTLRGRRGGSAMAAAAVNALAGGDDG